MVVAGIHLIDLLVWDRSELFDKSRAGDVTLVQTILNERRRLLRKWQERWDEDVSARWTYRLINDIEKCKEKGRGKSNYYLTQGMEVFGRTFIVFDERERPAVGL